MRTNQILDLQWDINLLPGYALNFNDRSNALKESELALSKRYDFDSVQSDSPRRNVVIGGGPTGTALAFVLRELGEDVLVLERDNPDDRIGLADQISNNFTLVWRSMQFYKDRGINLEEDVVEVVGRHIWTEYELSFTHNYGLRKHDRLYAVPREVLVSKSRRRAAELGVEFIGDARVVSLDAKRGKIEVVHRGGFYETIEADRLYVADGANSRSRDDVARQADVESHRVPDEYCYAVIHMSAEVAKKQGLELDRIHFVCGDGSVDIGIGNRDGSISLILERQYKGLVSDLSEEDRIALFTSGPKPLLREAVPDFLEQLCRRKIHRFKYAWAGVTHFEKALLVGDACRCWPPYLGQGLNAGIHDIASFRAAYIASRRNFSVALRLYDADRSEHARELDKLAKQHGEELLKGEFGSAEWRLSSQENHARELLLGVRTLYQHLVFNLEFPTPENIVESGRYRY